MGVPANGNYAVDSRAEPQTGTQACGWPRTLEIPQCRKRQLPLAEPCCELRARPCGCTHHPTHPHGSLRHPPGVPRKGPGDQEVEFSGDRARARGPVEPLGSPEEDVGLRVESFCRSTNLPSSVELGHGCHLWVGVFPDTASRSHSCRLDPKSLQFPACCQAKPQGLSGNWRHGQKARNHNLLMHHGCQTHVN